MNAPVQANILVIGYANASRRWETVLVSRLEALGHRVSIRRVPGPTRKHPLDRILAIESRRFQASLAALDAPLPSVDLGPADLVIDLTGVAGRQDRPVLTLELLGRTDMPDGVAAMLAHRALPEFVARIDGVAIGCARPVISDRLWMSRALDDMLAGAISLVVQSVTRFFAGRLEVIPDVASPEVPPRGFLRNYLPFVTRAFADRIAHKLRRRAIYWQVAYRLVDGPGIAETGRLDGPAFTELPDDGRRFYADPFVFEHAGDIFLFVEEFPYATGRGVISVARLGKDGRFVVPAVVLEEPHHLSYPQVFAQDGEIFIIPESSAARQVVLYRAAAFPDRWERDTVLIEGRDLNDMTLLSRDGRFWLLGTERYGHGSSSDTMVAYSAPDLRGPWKPHPLNPIAIDRAGARPGGAFMLRAGKVLLPVQDGSRAYGGGLGLMELLILDDENVVFAPPVAIGSGPAWARSGIHTLNRSGRLEVIDSAG